MGSLLVLIHMCNDVLPTACEDLPPSIRVPAQPLPHNFLMYQLSTHPFVDPGNSKQRTRKTNQCLFDWTSNKVHQKSVFPDSINCNGEIGRHGTPPSQKKIATICGFFPVRETWTWFCFTLDFFALLMAVDLRGPFCQQSEWQLSQPKNRLEPSTKHFIYPDRFYALLVCPRLLCLRRWVCLPVVSGFVPNLVLQVVGMPFPPGLLPACFRLCRACCFPAGPGCFHGMLRPPL